LKYIYFYNFHQCWYNKNCFKINKYKIIDTKTIDKNLKLDFTQGKDYNLFLVKDWFSKIPNQSLSDSELKNYIISILRSFEFGYGKHL
jgi:hypothetical protein